MNFPAGTEDLAHALGDLALRSASALVLAPIAIVIIWYGGPPLYVLLIFVAAGLCWEWFRLLGEASRAAVAGAAILLLASAAFAWLRADPASGRANVLFLLALVWATDIGAYFTGRTFGGPKLAPVLSPKKTWSGAAGGVLAAAGAGMGAALYQHTGLPQAVAIAAILSVIGQAGDLTKSAYKRRAGVKDSSRLIPGHGGLLDRLDSTLAVTLAAALLAMVRGRGVVLWQ